MVEPNNFNAIRPLAEVAKQGPPLTPESFFFKKQAVINQTGNSLLKLSLSAGVTALSIAGIAALTVGGIQTMFGYPPNWVQGIAGRSGDRRGIA